MIRTSLVITLICLTLMGGAAIADVINVPEDYPTIFSAVNSANDGDVIEVAAGTYLGSYLSPQGKSITISGELNADGSHAVILDGQQSGAVLWCYNGEDTSTVFRNLVLTNGSSYYGGGLSCYDGSSPALENCIFRDNTGTIEGGGVHLRENCNPYFIDCRIENNIAYGPGGGIFCMEYSNPTLVNCTISSNQASNGGGIYCSQSDPTITDCEISSNTANSGGGVFCYNSSSPTITGSTISSNTTFYGGGGIYSTGGTSNPTVTNCIIESNTTENYGGGFYGDYFSSPTYSGCTISGNTATFGGGCYGEGNSNPTLFGCDISNNSATRGGGIFLTVSSPDITECLIMGNTAVESGGGIFCYYVSNPVMTDTVLCSNAPDHIFGTWADNGGNTIADECPTCPGDATGDFFVDVNDVLYVLSAWGSDDVNADFDENGLVDVNDVLILLSQFGEACP